MLTTLLHYSSKFSPKIRLIKLDSLISEGLSFVLDTISVTRLGDFLDFGPLATIDLPKYPTFSGNFCEGVKIYLFLVKSFGKLL